MKEVLFCALLSGRTTAKAIFFLITFVYEVAYNTNQKNNALSNNVFAKLKQVAPEVKFVTAAFIAKPQNK